MGWILIYVHPIRDGEVRFVTVAADTRNACNDIRGGQRSGKSQDAILKASDSLIEACGRVDSISRIGVKTALSEHRQQY